MFKIIKQNDNLYYLYLVKDNKLCGYFSNNLLITEWFFDFNGFINKDTDKNSLTFIINTIKNLNSGVSY